MRTWIERVTVDRYFGGVLEGVKAMQKNGWSMTVLIAPDHETVVILGFFLGLRKKARDD